ncbi:Hsp20/alpha crystallin family protein [Chryseotalea sanaruensis]|jgi:HSP20 family protein|uniref:Hsp20/alpha crystallin family protein n=1 Tax=Chryseotalea sanaruensis TaxID=2482724 RepID=A0A401UD17_9BACT|nr:Hsp20/alpha crystallin family protein [Chryseotalea sanaruensis]GCC52774.1 Hsp20/alpha crystallin family protein [Chryseotalea sanaruensis]
MSLIKYNSVVNDFVPTSFGHVIDRFFNESVARTGGSTAYSFVPKVDVFEDEKAFEVQVAVPGMNKEDFKIDINEDRLTISGERKYSKEKKENNFRSIETSYGSFSRTFTLPDNIDVNKIEAAYNNGILELTLPKDEKKMLKTSIRVK